MRLLAKLSPYFRATLALMGFPAMLGVLSYYLMGNFSLVWIAIQCLALVAVLIGGLYSTVWGVVNWPKRKG